MEMCMYMYYFHNIKIQTNTKVFMISKYNLPNCLIKLIRETYAHKTQHTFKFINWQLTIC